ncbi:MAG: hypothetical protein PHT51_01770 [Patescibacteria group bacterium]|nr:hypothetical protein [Patescibacteria group bacterium]MDD4610375.1 hypothetical protein [Patescibacteria group bacterium]
MARIVSIGPNHWDVFDGKEKIGSINGFDCLGDWKFVATLGDKPITGHFQSRDEALAAIEKVKKGKQD